MKSIAVVTDSAKRGERSSIVGETIKNNILDVFKDKVTVEIYYIDNLSAGDIIGEDLTIVMAGTQAIKVRDFVLNNRNIIVAERTFSKNGIYQLFSIPENTDVLVVNDNIETVLDSISSLYHIGLKHINLIPFEKEKEYKKIEYAITPSEPELVPSGIPHVFDVGNRVLDIPTMLLIIKTLGLNDKATQQNLYNYYQMLFSANEGIVENYNKLLTRTEILDQLLDQSHDGILLTDTVGKILIFNKKFIEIFDISGEVKGKNIREILESSNLKDFNESDFYDDLIFFKKKIINMEKRTIIYFNYEKRIYFSFQEVTYIKKLEQNLSQKLRLKGQIARYTFKDIIGISERMKIIIDKAKKIAKSDLTILITGESGTGKEIMAQAIHNASPRKNQPFIAINSAALSDDLIESELFGYDRGSFTGALKEGKKGLFERGNNGTIFLDEIGDMPHHLQSKLLRVLQERQITPIGSDRIIDVDIRVIAATHKDPMEMIETGSFRKDLFYRLNVFPIKLPALRDRPEDIPILLQSFTGNTYTFNRECMNYLVHYNWPGNIRELINITQYISTVSEGKTVGLSSLPYYLETQLQENASPESFDEYEKERFILEQKTDFEQALYVMKAIKSLNEINKTAGRKHIDEVLKIKGIQIQENHLRKIMETLHLIDFIIIKKGRGGSFMTEKGLDFFQKAG
jgi:transcriptional regulator with PAS, ATPase and Fis domain